MRANKQGAHVMTKRAAIYARFSTDLQNEQSIEDQVTSAGSMPESTI